MKRKRVLQMLWLLFLGTACVLLFLWWREPTKQGQETLAPVTQTVMADAVSIPAPEASASPVPFTVPPTLSVTVAPTAAASTAAAAPSAVVSPTPAGEPFSLIWFSDTQYYAYKKPEILASMVLWANSVQAEYHTLALVQTGDIVDNHNYARHWENASAAFSQRADTLPLYCVAGNHDVGADTVDYTMYQTYHFCDVKDPDCIYQDGVCWVQPLDECKLLLVGIGWQLDADYADWVNARIAAYPDYTAIVLVHSFLHDNGALTTNGKLVEKQVLAKSPTVRLVLCGHNDGSVQWETTYEDGRVVHAILYNFQDDTKHGLGYARVLMFNPATRNIAVTTYSPYLDDFNYCSDEGKDTFTLYDAF